ncbi:zinc-dependent alcohol dehydrogenase family protein [Alphaproteobacteria bacterium]|nr:zinc-dependent alcohol dehydrogenase family protein [Alphaproteobacteria bacterium]
MKAVVFEEFGGDLSIQTVDDPTPRNDGVVLELLANGVCRSDWHAWQGHDKTVKLPHVPGHEAVGRVVAVGSDVKNLVEGDTVIVPFSCGCGVCPTCQTGASNICDAAAFTGFGSWGAFAQYMGVVYADNNLVKLPESLEAVEAASLGCRFMTAFYGVIHKAQVKAGQWVVVHGCGGLGLSAVMIAAKAGAQVIAVDIDDTKLNLAKSFGAIHGLNAAEDPKVGRAIRSLTSGGADVSIDALGHPTTAHNSVTCLRKRGKHLQLGLAIGDATNMPMPMHFVTYKELEILGSLGMPAHLYGSMLSMVTSGQFKPKDLVTSTVDLSGSIDALKSMGDFSTAGVVVIDDFS